MSTAKEQAYALLREWKGSRYIAGQDVMDRLGELVRPFGSRVLVVASGRHSAQRIRQGLDSMTRAGITFVTEQPVPGAKPNAPREDVYRLESYILHYQPDCVVAIGGGSTIDACKAAVALAAYGAAVSPEIDCYFGTGLVTAAMEKTGRHRLPMVAVETAASSGAHLTKYSNVTDPVAGQKLLIVDPYITPDAALFDYGITATMPVQTTLDGALDGIAHTVEAFWGAKPENYALLEQLTLTCLELTLENTRKILENPNDLDAREGLGLATDLGGYAIMVGGTSGAHLTSFSLVDLIPHGTACGIMNPYYGVFYAPAIQPQLKRIAAVFAKYGFMSLQNTQLEGRALAEAVAEAMIAFGRSIGAPVTLGELKGFREAHVDRILTAAQNPSLSMKLKNMPVSMTCADVYPYMESVIRSAVDGDLRRILTKEV